MYKILIPVLFSAASTVVLGQQVIPAPNYDQGWCYYCSDDNAPPLCNSDCVTAVSNLCGSGNLTESLTETVGTCQLQYMPPVYNMKQDGSHQEGVSEQVCTDYFDQILYTCGKDAGSPGSTTINSSYCTTSGGGGTYGWNDDGSVMTNTFGRYIVTTNGTDQCGQAEASWQQADSVIMWNDTWIGPNDQVVLDTNPPAISGSAAALASAMPTPNPECDTEVCDIYDNPYYAQSPIAPWAEGGKNMMRHRVVYEGWSEDSGSTRLFNSIEDRCGPLPGNFQVYMNGTHRVADFDLQGPQNDLCWCIPDAIFDASVGIVLARDAFCSPGWTPTDSQGMNEFVPVG